jgi:ABC-type bacteriocin/lantibiotic exporter with double-glycine peptidase domain
MTYLPKSDPINMDDRHARHARENLSRLISLERLDLWALVAFSLGAGLMALATPVAVQTLVNTIAFGMLLQPLVVLVLVLLGCLAMNNILIAFQIYVVEMLQRRIFVRLLGDIAGRLQRVRLEAFDGRNGPELVNRFFDLMTVQKAASVLLLDGLAYALQTLIGMLLLAFYHPILLTFDLLLVIAVLFIFFVMGRHAIPTAVEESRTKYAVAAWLEELARNVSLVKWAGGADFVSATTDRLAREYLGAAGKHFRIVMRQQVGILALQTLASTLLLGLGGWLVIERQLTLGQLIAAELVVSAMLGGISRLGKSLTSYYELMSGMNKLSILLDLPLESEQGEKLSKRMGPMAVTLQDLGYAYPGERHSDSGLVHVNARIAPGERIALVGSSGSGRGTLLELMMGLRVPGSGALLLDGHDLRDLNVSDLRERLALIKDEGILEASVLDNLRMGREDVHWDALQDTLRGVALDTAIHALPDGLNTRLNFLGMPLPPEQVRRLLLARALVGRPRLLLIYDALDTIDPRVSEEVIAWVLRSDAPWTVVVATRNPSVIRRCDHVWRINQGGVREIPSEELLDELDNPASLTSAT